MFENMFENRKSSKIRKKVDNGLLPRKMVDRDALCPINVMSSKFNQLQDLLLFRGFGMG